MPASLFDAASLACHEHDRGASTPVSPDTEPTDAFRRALTRVTSARCTCLACRVAPVAVTIEDVGGNVAGPTPRSTTPARAFHDSATPFALAKALCGTDLHYGCELIRRLVDLCAAVNVYGGVIVGRRTYYDEAQAIRWPGSPPRSRRRAQPKRRKPATSPVVSLFPDLAVAVTDEAQDVGRDGERR